MHPEAYRQLSHIENDHWWFVSRLKLIEEILNSLGKKKEGKGLEIGSGIGGNLILPEKFCEQVVGLEISDLALEMAKKKWPNRTFVKGDANYVKDFFPENSFTLVTILNVLYHQWIRSEENVLQQVHQLLRPDGLLVLTEPAFDFLTRSHDFQVLGRQRYKMEFFTKILQDLGFEIILSTYFNSISFLPALILSINNRYFQSAKENSASLNQEVDEVRMPSAWLNSLMKSIMRCERKTILKCKKIPFGVSLLCIARKINRKSPSTTVLRH